ncbi:MAG: winged helix-turn-helix transcriptional regulator [Methanobacteriota archaeon]
MLLALAPAAVAADVGSAPSWVASGVEFPALATEQHEPVQQAAGTVLSESERLAGPVAPSPPPVDLSPPGDFVVTPEGSAAILGLVLFGAAFLIGGAKWVTSENVLASETRRGLYAFLVERSGASLKEITDRLDLSTTNALWHLRKLEASGLVRGRKFNGFKLYYPVAGGVETSRRCLVQTALANKNARVIYDYVRTHPGTHQREIARALGVNHGTVRWHLRKLQTVDLLESQTVGKTANYYPRVFLEPTAAPVSTRPETVPELS